MYTFKWSKISVEMVSRVRLIVDVIKSYFGWACIDFQTPVVVPLYRFVVVVGAAVDVIFSCFIWCLLDF